MKRHRASSDGTSGPRTRSKRTAGEGLLLGYLICGGVEVPFYSYTTQSIRLEGVDLMAAVQADGSITLARTTTRDDKAARHRACLQQQTEELAQRKAEIKALDVEISELMDRVRQQDSEAASELTARLQVQGNHQSECTRIRSKAQVTVRYERVKRGQKACLRDGVCSRVPWFDRHVVWCTSEEEAKFVEVEEVEEMVEEMPKPALYAVYGDVDFGWSSVERFDPAKNKWTKVASTAGNTVGVGLVDGQLYAVIEKDGRYSRVDRLDPAENKWTVMASMTTKRSCCGVGVVDGQLYAVGGIDSNRQVMSSVERFDPAENKWTKVASMTTKRSNCGVGVVGGQLYAVGGTTRLVVSSVGRASCVHVASRTVERFDPAENKWTTVASMTAGRSCCGVGVFDGQLYAVGGVGDKKLCLSSVERFNPAEGEWTVVASMTTVRSSCGVGVVDGQLYAVGGFHDSGWDLKSVEQFDLAENKWIVVAR